MSQPTPEAPAPAKAPETAGMPTGGGDILEYYGTPAWIHGASVTAAVLGPLGLLLPPRQMGLRNLLLAGGTFFATSQLTYDYTGQSLFQRFQIRASQATSSDLPEAAVQRQAAMRAERERRRLAAAAAAAQGPADGKEQTPGALHKLWMGNEKADWTRERAQHEKDVLDSGGGYWELIMEQIGDVWTDLTKKSGKEGEDKPEEKR